MNKQARMSNEVTASTRGRRYWSVKNVKTNVTGMEVTQSVEEMEAYEEMRNAMKRQEKKKVVLCGRSRISNPMRA